ncbi:protein-L-isoaspartate(D-aspartate) O-methyltransferase [Achromobacter sp. F4_2707]|uniref:protein-L-isoaspartate(D-aspartate) O-methyltransferase n=1 Tax=Achromobacter sp. F4_2707 TaxID=3114286 RepID=UPI0039C621B1
MRKPLNPSPFASGTINRFGRSSLGGGPSPANSNTRILGAGPKAKAAPPFAVKPFSIGSAPGAAASSSMAAGTADNLGLSSQRSRERMVSRLREQGINDERVLAAMRAVSRHLFVDEGLASRAYDDAALPIGYEQTISQPWVVARMISVLAEGRELDKVLEVGAGCGYQAAVLAHVAREVHTIERIHGLYEMARHNLQKLRVPGRVRVVFGDGMAGLPGSAPFDAITIAAAGLKIPQALLEQLAPGGRLIAPEGGVEQRLILIERTGVASWKRQELDAVRFVPLRPGTQY